MLSVIVAAAAVARLWRIDAGIPHAVGIDEPQIVDRALRILHTGDWNTHIFDYPTLVIYLHAMVAIGRFLWGALNGEWASLDAFSITAVYLAGRAVAALIGVATVWLTYRIGRELDSRRVALLAAAQMATIPLHVRESHFILRIGALGIAFTDSGDMLIANVDDPELMPEEVTVHELAHQWAGLNLETSWLWEGLAEYGMRTVAPAVNMRPYNTRWESLGFKDKLGALMECGRITERAFAHDRHYSTSEKPDGVFCVYARN